MEDIKSVNDTILGMLSPGGNWCIECNGPIDSIHFKYTLANKEAKTHTHIEVYSDEVIRRDYVPENQRVVSSDDMYENGGIIDGYMVRQWCKGYDDRYTLPTLLEGLYTWDIEAICWTFDNYRAAMIIGVSNKLMQ